MFLDFRELNEKTIGDSYPLPNINDILDSLGSVKYFSVFDSVTGFTIYSVRYIKCYRAIALNY